MSGLSQLDPAVAQAEEQIEKQKLPPDKAVSYLLSKGVDPRLASLVMKYRMLKQSAANQPQKQQPTTVSQDLDNQLNAASAQRGQGISGLPVPNSTFNMASGGIIAFDDGGMATMGNDPSDYSAQMQNQFLQNLMSQQNQQQASTIAQGPGMAEGGDVDNYSRGPVSGRNTSDYDSPGGLSDAERNWVRQMRVSYGDKKAQDLIDTYNKNTYKSKKDISGYAEGGDVDDDSETDLQSQTAAIYKRQLADWQRANAQNYLAKGQKLGVAPQQVQQNKEGGYIRKFDGGGDTAGDPTGTPGEGFRELIDLVRHPNVDPRTNEISPNSPFRAVTRPAPGTINTAPIQPAASAAPPPPPKPSSPVGPGTPPPGLFDQQRPMGPNAPVPQGAPPPPAQQGAPGGPNNAGATASMSARTSSGPNGIPSGMQQELNKDQADADMARQAVGTVQSHSDDLMKVYSQQGIGAAAKEHLAYLDQLQGQLSQLQSKGNSMAMIQMGLGMARAATENPHGGFLGALAVGGQEGAKAYQENIEKYRDLNMKAMESRYQVQEAQENIKMNADKEALQSYNNALTRYDNLTARVDAARIRAVELMYSKEMAQVAARATIMGGYKGTPEAMIAANWLMKNPNASEEELLDFQKKLAANMPTVQSAQARAQVGLDEAQIRAKYGTAGPQTFQSYSRQLATNQNLKPEQRTYMQNWINEFRNDTGGGAGAGGGQPVMSLNDYLTNAGH